MIFGIEIKTASFYAVIVVIKYSFKTMEKNFFDFILGFNSSDIEMGRKRDAAIWLPF